jgi:hypothetical protein
MRGTPELATEEPTWAATDPLGNSVKNGVRSNFRWIIGSDPIFYF